MTIPPDLLRAAVEGGGRIAFVLGAGCSVEPPTGLPLAGNMARELYDRLVNEQILEEGACDAPENLEAVVDAVLSAAGGKREVVSRLPKRALRLAKPNTGHRVLAAMMYEGAVTSALTINFDLAVDHALADSGANNVDIVVSHREHRDFGNSAVIYLHGSANSPDDDWILTSEEVERGWEDGWKDLVTRRVVASPVVVVAGVGTLVGVLLRSLRLIIESLPDEAQVYCVGPDPFEDSGVAESLGLSQDRYIQLGWCEFSKALSDPVYGNQMIALKAECERLAALQGEPNALPGVLAAIEEAGLIDGGQVRSHWFLANGSYLPWSGLEPRWVAELITATALSADALGASVALDAHGVFRLSRDDGGDAAVACIHGKGRLRWSELELQLAQRRKSDMGDYSRFDLVLVAGVEGPQLFELAPPSDLFVSENADDIVNPATEISFLLATDTVDIERVRSALA